MEPWSRDLIHRTLPASNPTSPTTIYELHDGYLVCSLCPPAQHFSCGHVVVSMQQGCDRAGDVSLPPVVIVPIVRGPDLLIPVELDAPDRNMMRLARLAGEVDDADVVLGYMSPTEGRWLLRDLIIGYLRFRYDDRPKCRNGCDTPDLRGPVTRIGLNDTWCLLTEMLCHACVKQRANASTSLIPTV